VAGAFWFCSGGAVSVSWDGGEVSDVFDAAVPVGAVSPVHGSEHGRGANSVAGVLEGAWGAGDGVPGRAGVACFERCVVVAASLLAGGFSALVAQVAVGA